jgi:hypothetical protein
VRGPEQAGRWSDPPLCGGNRVLRRLDRLHRVTTPLGRDGERRGCVPEPLDRSLDHLLRGADRTGRPPDRVD